MIHRRLAKSLGLAVLSLTGLVISHASQAGVIGSYDGAVGAGTATVDGMDFGPIDTIEPNDATPNGAGGPSPNVLDVSKVFTSFDPIDMVFTVNNSGGVTSYLFDEDVTNNTGLNITDFHFVLGFGTGASFVPAQPGGGVEFDPSNPASSTVFSTSFQSKVLVSWFGPPGLSSGATGSFNVQILTFDSADPATSYQFTLREFPSIPEPSSIVLVGIGFAGMVGYTVRRRATT